MVIHRLPVRLEDGINFVHMQAELTEVGRIRLGVFDPDKGGRGAPDKLETFRFTSQQELLIRKVAERYGGEAEEYQPQRSKRTEWQVITTAKMVPVYIEPQRIDPWLEAWGSSQGGSSRCIRRCDGVTETKQDVPCPCAAGEVDERDMCKPVARVRLLLAEVPGIGVWRLESHGTSFVQEIAGLAPYIAALPFRVPGLLYLEERRAQPWVNGRQLSTTVYVPHLSISVATPEQFAIGGDVLTRALEAGTPNALGAGRQAPALEARPREYGPVEDWMAQIERSSTLGGLEEIREEIAEARSHLDDATYERLGAAWVEAKNRVSAAGQPSALTQATAAEMAEVHAANPVARLAESLDKGLVAMAEKNGLSVAEARAAILAQIEACDTTGAIEELVGKFKAKNIGDKTIKDAAKSRYAAIVAAAEVGGSAPGPTSVTSGSPVTRGNAEHQAALRAVQREATDVVDAVLVDEPPAPLDDQGPPPDWAVEPVAAPVESQIGTLEMELNAVYTVAGERDWTTAQTNTAIKQAAGVEKISELKQEHATALHILTVGIRGGTVTP